MIPHLFKLIWNKKKSHSLMIVEIWASFMVLFGLTTLIVVNVGNYRKPLGFSYENVWAISLKNNQDTTDVADKIQRIAQRLKIVSRCRICIADEQQFSLLCQSDW